ncbi:MAG: YbaB/EbfC family nucleoid-associated protein [Candidatus Saganbacteria bacterium]|nr:YbaB/EbfC family nucleoid-associated protein [Candidatus Saganbacteria bacterium]
MFDINEMMKQAKQMQDGMKKASEELSAETVTAGSGRGAVIVTMNGNMEIKEIKIDPALAPTGDAQRLSEMIKTAVNEALEKAKKLSSSKMSSMTGGMNIPGLSSMLGI